MNVSGVQLAKFWSKLSIRKLQSFELLDGGGTVFSSMMMPQTQTDNAIKLPPLTKHNELLASYVKFFSEEMRMRLNCLCPELSSSPPPRLQLLISL